MTLPAEYLALVGSGEHVTIDGRDLIAYPMTASEYIEYIAISPKAEIKEVDGVKTVVYASKADEAQAMKSSWYVLWTVLRKNGVTGQGFELWMSSVPGGYINPYLGLISKVLEATAGPVSKKN